MRYNFINEKCTCYWPERSPEAAKISDLAYRLFDDLITNTSLSCLLNDQEERKGLKCEELNKHGLLVYLVGSRFRFTDYFVLCQSLETYAKYRFEGREMAEIQDKLDTILETLFPKFLSLCTACHIHHPNVSVAREIRFMKNMIGDISDVDELPEDFAEKGLDGPLEAAIMDSEVQDALASSIDPLQGDSPCKENEEEAQNNGWEEPEVPPNNGFPGLKAGLYCNQSIEIYKTWDCDHDNPGDDEIDYLEDFDPLMFTRQFQQGVIYNNKLLYDRAIKDLSSVIKSCHSWYVPQNLSRLARGNKDDSYYVTVQRNALAERALAYFETNRLGLAIQDYESARKLTIRPQCSWVVPMRKGASIYIPKHKLEFSRGLINGHIAGAKVATTEFFPSLFDSFSGILHGLWAFACDPKDVSEEYLAAAYNVGEFVYTYGAGETIKILIPEIKELALSWNILDDYGKGEKIGYIIGKYGVEVFLPVALFRGANKVYALKRANTMLTLERCALSEANAAVIQKESAKAAAIRGNLIKDALKSGKILARNYNAKCHIMQEKHAWKKVVALTGNVEKDFDLVVDFLEQNKITKARIVEDPLFFPTACPEIKKVKYEKTLESCKIHAEFEVYLKTGEAFLQDAWIVTK
jgi:tetratricopeptide (TPR) repeat protein